MYHSPFRIERHKLQATKPGIQGKIKASDSLELAYTAYTLDKPYCCLIFYHGGGAHSVDYTRLAQNLQESYGVATFLFDIRGHGQSEGARGDAPLKEQVWSDINSAIHFVRSQYPNTDIYLGGHSSGCGLLLNYSNWASHISIKGYIMIAPEFGPKIAPQKANFASVNLLAIFLNKLTRGLLFKKRYVVRFNYSSEQIDEWHFLPGYTMTMAEALTPNKPHHALVNIAEPLYILIAAEDELINNDKLIEVLSQITPLNTKIVIERAQQTKHIMILENVHSFIGTYLTKKMGLVSVQPNTDTSGTE